MKQQNEIKERPILFSGLMVRAILEGRKTQTRRVVKGIALDWLAPDMFTPEFVGNPENSLCPYGKPGDRLWVRETWRWFDAMIESDQESVYSGYQYRADIEPSHDDGLTWKPSIHMPRAACRILLEIADVRVERLRDISEDDARAEGVEFKRAGVTQAATGWKHYLTGFYNELYARDSFHTLWQSIYGPESWAQNPWVWVVEFKKIEQ